MFEAYLTFGAIEASIHTDLQYPDMAVDVTNRLMEMINYGLEQAKIYDWNPLTPIPANPYQVEEE